MCKTICLVNGTANSLIGLLGGSNVTLPGCDNSTGSDETIESEVMYNIFHSQII